MEIFCTIHILFYIDPRTAWQHPGVLSLSSRQQTSMCTEVWWGWPSGVHHGPGEKEDVWVWESVHPRYHTGAGEGSTLQRDQLRKALTIMLWCDPMYQLVSIVFSFSVLRFTFIHGNGRTAKTIISQGVVTFMSRVEAFAKLNQAIKVFFESWSRWPPNCTDQEHIAAIFDPWTTENQVIKGFERKGTIKWSRTLFANKKCWFQSQTPQHITTFCSSKVSWSHEVGFLILTHQLAI